MNTISELKNSSNVEQIVNGLFELIQQKDKNISSELYNFDNHVMLKVMSISKELASPNSEDTLSTDKKTQLESYYKDILKFTEVFDLLDKKVDNEIKNNSSLSTTDKENLQQDILYTIRQKRFDLSLIQQRCEGTLSVVEKQNNDNIVSGKVSVSERIKSMKTSVVDNNNSTNKKTP